jgi:hypothetical protein
VTASKADGVVLLYDDVRHRNGHQTSLGRPCNLSDDDGWCYDHNSYDCPRLATDLPIGCAGFHRDPQCAHLWVGTPGINIAHHHHDKRCWVVSGPLCAVADCDRVENADNLGMCAEHQKVRHSFGSQSGLGEVRRVTAAYTLHGTRFVVDARIEPGTLVYINEMGSWVGDGDTIDYINNNMGSAKRLALTQSITTGRNGGVTVVRGVVKQNVRRPPSSSYTVSDLEPLVKRAEHLVIQIASRDDWTPGARDGLLRSFAAIQDEVAKVRDQLDEVDGHLSVVRGQLMDFAISPGA